MKKFILMLTVMLLSIFCVFSSPVFLERTDSTEPLLGQSKLKVSYDYDPERYYRFIFSDRFIGKDGNFQDLFESSGLNQVLLTKFVDGHIESDKTLYIYWLLDNSNPIGKLTIEVAGPLTMANGEKLDLYISCDDKVVAGGSNGYGVENAQVLYDRADDDRNEELTDSVRLYMWTGDISGKPAGNYESSVILRVYSDDEN